MLFAAGFGTRMGALTAQQPKPMVPVAGRPLIDHALTLCHQAKLSRIVINLHYRGDQLRTHLANQDVMFSEEQPEVLETGGGLRKALPLLGEAPVFTLNSDAVWTGQNPLLQLAKAWDPARMDALLLLVPKPNAQGHTGNGDFLINDQGQLSRGAGAVYSGAQIIKTDMLASMPKGAFSLNLCWNEMQQQGRLFGTLHDGGWCDVGQPDSIALAENMLAQPENAHAR